MQKRNALVLAPLVMVSVALLAVWGGAASAAGKRTGGSVRIYEADTSLNGSVGTIILTGAVADHGKDHQGFAGGGTINKLVLSKGSLEINVGPIGSKLSARVNPKTCSFADSATAPVPIVKGTGTGAYRGISGTFKTTVTTAGILPRLKNGKCNTSSSAKLVAGILLAKGAGTVSFK